MDIMSTKLVIAQKATFTYHYPYFPPGANVNSRKSNGWTPIHWAAQNNYPQIVQLLLGNKANVNVPAAFDEHIDCLPIHQAAQHGHTPILRMLIKAGANVNAVKSQGKVSGMFLRRGY